MVRGCGHVNPLLAAACVPADGCTVVTLAMNLQVAPNSPGDRCKFPQPGHKCEVLYSCASSHWPNSSEIKLVQFIKSKCRTRGEDGGEIGGSRVHFPSTPVKHLADLRSRANSQWYSSIYEDWRPKIEDIERYDGKKSA